LRQAKGRPPGTGRRTLRRLDISARALDAAKAEALRHGESAVLILSARHGLLALDDVVSPYDMRMGEQGCITSPEVTEQAHRFGIQRDDEVYALLPVR
jgi:hypothetical protein